MTFGNNSHKDDNSSVLWFLSNDSLLGSFYISEIAFKIIFL